MKKLIAILSLFMITYSGFSQAFPNRNEECGMLKVNKGVVYSVTTVTASTYTVTLNDYNVVATAASASLTLPQPSVTVGQVFNVKNLSAGNVTVYAPSVSGVARLIDSAATKVVAAKKILQVQSNGTNYYITNYSN